MPIYEYKARNEEGQLVSERIAFRDEIALRQYLRKSNLFLLEVAEKHKIKLQIRRKVGLGDLIIMVRNW